MKKYLTENGYYEIMNSQDNKDNKDLGITVFFGFVFMLVCVGFVLWVALKIF